MSSDFLFSTIFTCSLPSAFATDRVGGLHDKLVYMQGRLPKIQGEKPNTRYVWIPETDEPDILQGKLEQFITMLAESECSISAL